MKTGSVNNMNLKKISDAGMAFTLVFLLLGLILNNVLFYKIAIPALFLNMLFPRIYYPFALLWYGLSDILGSIVSKILLALIYLLFVVPIGFIRRLSGKDSMFLRKFKTGNSSVLITRNKVFTAEDIKNPY